MTDSDYLKLAYELASKNSDDPRTQLGAVLVNPENYVIGLGVNSLPRDVKVLPERLERPQKYSWMEHAERNAIFHAAAQGFSTTSSTLYCPWFACADCARGLIQAGVTKIVGHKQIFDKYGEGPWTESINIGNQMFLEAGVETVLYDGNLDAASVIFNGEKSVF